MNDVASPETIAANAKKARLRVGLATHEAAAKKIECSRTLVLAWENQKNPTPINGSQYLLAAARVYKVRPEWLAEGIEPDGYPWHGSDAQLRSTQPTSDSSIPVDSLTEVQLAQALMAQALAESIPTAGRALVDSLVNLPGDPADRPYIRALLGTIRAELARQDKLRAPKRRSQGSRARKPR